MIEISVPSHYAGREQAFIKHYFLKTYLERLIHKTASAYNEIAYVDGYSGPWKSSDDNYGDTSFGIALKSLTAARESWLGMPRRSRDVRMTAHLVEKNLNAFKELKGIDRLFPEVSVHPYQDDFLKIASEIACAIPSSAFTFTLIDPKGFNLDLMALKPLIDRPCSEVVFNFMFDYANRFTDLPSLAKTYDRLFPNVNWRAKLEAVSNDPNAGPIERKSAFLDCFKEAVRTVGGYKYVADVDIRYPGKDRTFYFLVYGTREPAGIEVFRDCQVRALEAQSMIAGQKSLSKREENGQAGLFGPEWETAPATHRSLLDHEREKAHDTLLNIAASQPGSLWGYVWPQMLAKHAIRKPDANAIATSMYKSGKIKFPDWKDKKRVPANSYRTYLA